MKKISLIFFLIGILNFGNGYSKVSPPSVATIDGIKYTKISDPFAGSGGTKVVGVYGRCVVGNYTDISNINHGFAYDGLNFKTIDLPMVDNSVVRFGTFGSYPTNTYISGVTSNNIVGKAYNYREQYGFAYDGLNFLYIPTGGNNINGIIDNVIYGTGALLFNGSYEITNGIKFAANSDCYPRVDNGDNIQGVDGNSVVSLNGNAAFLIFGSSCLNINPPSNMAENLSIASVGISKGNIFVGLATTAEFYSYTVKVENSASSNVVNITNNIGIWYYNNITSNNAVGTITFNPIIYPHTYWYHGGTQVTGIYSNVLVGNYTDNNNLPHGFYCIGEKNYSTIDCPLAIPGGTYVSGISGNVAFGYYTDTNGITNGFTATISAIPPVNQVSSIIIPTVPSSPTSKLKISKTNKG